MFGALAFTTLNIGGIVAESWGFDRVPGLLFNDPGTPLVGASAGVFGVILAGAFLQPNARVVVWFFFPMRLKTMAYGLVALAIFTIFEMARTLVARPATLVVLWRERISYVAPTICTGSLTFWARWIPPANASASERPKPRPRFLRIRGRANDEEVDRILDKISQKGLHSLTPKEKEILNRASKDRQ